MEAKSQNLGHDKADYYTTKGTIVFLRKENCMYQASDVVTEGFKAGGILLVPHHISSFRGSNTKWSYLKSISHGDTALCLKGMDLLIRHF